MQRTLLSSTIIQMVKFCLKAGISLTGVLLSVRELLPTRPHRLHLQAWLNCLRLAFQRAVGHQIRLNNPVFFDLFQ